VKIAVLASGRGSNFQALCSADLGPGRVSLLLSDRSEAPALGLARMSGVEALFLDPGPKRTVFSPEAELEWARALEDRGIELVCLAGLMRMLRHGLLTAYGGRMLNIHPSLLPAFPGLHAQRQALARGVKVSGCTVHYVDPGMDSGPIVMQAAVPVLEGDTEETLSQRILEKEHSIYPEAVRLHCEGRLRLDGGIVRVTASGTSGRLP
jgi:phosphoribosylglycinamide formyltransferase-1